MKKIDTTDLKTVAALVSGLLATGHYTTPGAPNVHPKIINAVVTLDKREVKRGRHIMSLALVHALRLHQEIKQHINDLD